MQTELSDALFLVVMTSFNYSSLSPMSTDAYINDKKKPTTNKH